MKYLNVLGFLFLNFLCKEYDRKTYVAYIKIFDVSARHSCTKCHKATKLYCYCCPKAVCSRCISAAKFLAVRGNKGLCEECVEYVHCVEDKDDVDADGVSISPCVSFFNSNMHMCILY